MAAASGSPDVFMYVCVVLYLLSLIVVAIVARRRKQQIAADKGGFRAHFGGAFGPALLVLTTFSSLYSGFTVTGVPEEAYKRGFISLRWVGATLVVVTGMLIVYPRLRRLSATRGYQSPNDFITDRYHSGRLRFLAAVCGYVPMLTYLAAQMISFAAVVRGLTYEAVPDWASLLVLCAVILGLEKLGGMSSVVLTDAAQSAIMLTAFLVVPFALGGDFGFLSSIGPPNCDSLTYLMPSAGGSDENPGACPSQEPAAATAAGCVAAGCAGAVRPSFYEYPTRTDQADICFFLINMLAVPLQPHMIQRAYIAESDGTLRTVMGVLLLAPFLAQWPGIQIGITKAAFEPMWPRSVQEATAFSAVSDVLASRGTFQYVLVTLMACSTLAAIMSTSDSVLMGASNLMSVDIFKGLLKPSASTKLVVFIGEMNSVAMAIAGFIMASILTVGQLGKIIVFQNGLLLQLVPAYGLGLYTNISERPVAGGVAAGLLALVVLVGTGNPLDPYVPLVNVSVFANLVVLAVLQVAAPGPDERAGWLADAARAQFGERLTRSGIASVMAGSREPNRQLLGLMLALLLLSVPMYGRPGAPEPSVAGLPRWALFWQALMLLVLLLGVIATKGWRVAKEEGGHAHPEKPSPEIIGEPNPVREEGREGGHKEEDGHDHPGKPSPEITGEPSPAREEGREGGNVDQVELSRL